jgi:hypothetical protein
MDPQHENIEVWKLLDITGVVRNKTLENHIKPFMLDFKFI